MLENISQWGIYKFVNKCPILDRWELKDIISLDFSKKISEATGTGTLVLAYSKERFERIGQGDELKIQFGYEYPEEVTDPETGERTKRILKDAIYGFVAEVRKTKREIEVNFADAGVCLEQKINASYTDKTVKEILGDLVHRSGLRGIVRLSKKKLETKITLQEQEQEGGDGGAGGGSTSGGHASGQFQCACGRSDCPLPKSGSGRWVTCTTQGPCVCGATNWAYNRCPPDCSVNKCAGRGRGDTRAGGPGDRFPEGHFFCCNCDADYCGCGVITDGSGRRVIKTSCGGAATATGSGGESSSSQEMTIWDAILKVLEKWEYEVHVYVKGTDVIIEEIQLPEKSDTILAAWSDHNIIEESFGFSEGKAPIVTGVKINYGGGDSKKKQNVVYDKDITKYPETRYPGIVDVTWPEVSGEDAALLGKRILRTIQRVESSESVGCDIIADPMFWVGKWVHVKNNPEDYREILYLKGISHKLAANDVATSLEMSLWKPPVGEKSEKGESGAGSGSGNASTLDQILREAAKFGYCKGCSDAQCLVKRGCGDCHAMSDYLFNKLSQAGFKVRIIQYSTSLAWNHRTVQIYQNGQWVDIPYREYGFNTLFRTTPSRPGLFVYKSN